MKVNVERLRAITNRLLDHMLEEGINEVDLSSDYYWNIQPELRYDKYDEPTVFTMGQLSEDLQFLEQIQVGERPPTSYGLVWAAALLRFIGEQVVK